jgi:POT family proton-dependent oligopeptide transporter
LSSMTRLAPARVAGLMMGVWFLAAAVGNFIGGRLSTLYEAWRLPNLFGIVAAVGIASGILLLLFSRPIERWMEGIA